MACSFHLGASVDCLKLFRKELGWRICTEFNLLVSEDKLDVCLGSKRLNDFLQNAFDILSKRNKNPKKWKRESLKE